MTLVILDDKYIVSKSKKNNILYKGINITKKIKAVVFDDKKLHFIFNNSNLDNINSVFKNGYLWRCN